MTIASVLAGVLALVLHLQLDPASVGRPAADEFAAARFGQFSARFNEKMRAAAGEPMLHQVHDRLTQQLGAYVKIAGDTTCTATAGIHSCLTPLQFERGRMTLRVAVSAEGRVAGFSIVALEPTDGWAPGANAKIVAGSLTLPAIVTLPEAPRPAPLIVLVHGSGAHDADETVGPNKPFRDLAEGLAARGIATLRYVKRNRIAPLPASATLDDEVTTDALAAVALARATAGVDGSRIFVLGHSLGGYMAPHIASKDPQIAGIIVMAGNTRTLRESLTDQLNHLTGTADGVDASMAQLPARYRDLLAGYDPPEAARSLKRPVLVLQGGRDYQVNEKDFARWMAVLTGNPTATLKRYPRLNHLFLEGDGVSMPAEYEQPGRIPAQVLDDIAGWVRAAATTGAR
jgi:dienelactone hydrolase